MQVLECLFIANNAVEPWESGFGHQVSPVFTINLSFLNLSNTLLVQPISMKKAASACKFGGLQTDVGHTYTEHLLPIKNRLLNTLTYSTDLFKNILCPFKGNVHPK